MHIAVFGAGGVGGYFGGRLAQAGHRVSFIAHGNVMQPRVPGVFHVADIARRAPLLY